MSINSILEIVRWAGVGLGVFLANLWGGTPQAQFSLVCFWTVAPVAGLTGIESLFLGQRAAEQSGYGAGGAAYQRQSGLNNLALALACLLAYALGWGLMAQAALMSTLLIFLCLSAANHAYSAFKENNLRPKNLLRPLLTALLLAVTLPYMIAALAA
ncbi:MAG: hypothetical protein K9K66_14805 [Desulfarculaceae bacterium]|nr:hypothetical protein [Desulfarculaceae bacterium]MCF8072462.1 hypothetical protein [Desulfarculaceae bacterium]MCF8102923.1 hypothetical protein [Desulfarculaceae bacterium]MCF8117474.1 hypothetical protein [Desulfarculaceae bacterium]